MIDDTLSAPLLEELERAPLGPGADIRAGSLTYEDADGAALEGYLARDAELDGTRRPGVLVLPDWSGVGPYAVMRAQMLARLGYVALAGDVYGEGVHPTGDGMSAEAGKYYGDLPLFRRRVAAGFARLADDEHVDRERIVVMGYCFGGSGALEFARTGEAVAGAAAFHGGLMTHDAEARGTITTRLLIMTGGADEVVPDSAVTAYQDELREMGVDDWEVDTYAGAPHAFTDPSKPSFRRLANERSWARFTSFLTEVLD